jgi:catechol 2,3-dioxygenase-like lactoylglutathione lyase family enzyme
MEPRISLITLGVADVARARKFYVDGLGWPVAAFGGEAVAFLPLAGVVLALYRAADFAKDTGRPRDAAGSAGIALAHNVRSRAEVDRVFALAERAGASLLKAPEAKSWGGYAGYFADPDGHAWEIAWNPGFPIRADGSIELQS